MVASETLSLRLQGSRLGKQKCNRKWDLAAHCSEANEEARLVKRKACFNFSADNRGKGGRVSIGRLLSTDSQGAKAYIDRGRGLHAETAQSILQLAIGGLISVILIGWVQLIFSSRVSLFPFPWDQFSHFWQFMSWLQSDHQVINFFHLVGVSVYTRQLPGDGSKYYL